MSRVETMANPVSDIEVEKQDDDTLNMTLALALPN